MDGRTHIVCLQNFKSVFLILLCFCQIGAICVSLGKVRQILRMHHTSDIVAPLSCGLTRSRSRGRLWSGINGLISFRRVSQVLLAMASLDHQKIMEANTCKENQMCSSPRGMDASFQNSPFAFQQAESALNGTASLDTVPENEGRKSLKLNN